MNPGSLITCLIAATVVWVFFTRTATSPPSEQVLGEGLKRYPVDLYTYCLMGNHWHLVLEPREAGAMGRLPGMGGRHARSASSRALPHPRRRPSLSGKIQEFSHTGRLSFPACFVDMWRPMRIAAGIVSAAEDWRWGGLFARGSGEKPIKLSRWPVDRPSRWRELVNDALSAAELAVLRTKVNRGQPYGAEAWVGQTARRLGLASTMNRVGRPAKRGNQ